MKKRKDLKKPNITQQGASKRRTNQAHSSRRRKITKIRVEINENKKTSSNEKLAF